jgi:hypothetical protein
MYITNNNGKADRELQETLKTKGFVLCGRKPYSDVIDGNRTIDEEVRNQWSYTNFEIEQYKLVTSKQISIKEYNKLVKEQYDIAYGNIERAIKKWKDSYSKLPQFVKDIFDEYDLKTVGISPDEGIIYVNITNYNDSDISFVTFTGKVLYIVDDLITDE